MRGTLANAGGTTETGRIVRGVECNNVRFRYNYCSMRNAVAAAILIALVVPSGSRFFHLLYLSGLIDHRGTSQGDSRRARVRLNNHQP